MSKKVILFDIGNVFLKPIHGEIINLIYEKKKNDLEYDEYKCEVTEILNESFEGKISLKETWERLFELVNLNEDDKKTIIEFSVVRNEELIEYVTNDLSKRYSIGIISDLSQIGYNVFKNNYKELYDICDKDKVFISVDTGKTKSKNGKEYFKEVSNSLKVNPKEVCFIDDEIKNIENAKSANFNTILFESHEFNWNIANQKMKESLKDLEEV